MPDLHLTVHTEHHGANELTSPSELKVSDLIEEIRTQLGLPEGDWRLDDKNGRRKLDPERTLAENGVDDNHALYLWLKTDETIRKQPPTGIPVLLAICLFFLFGVSGLLAGRLLLPIIWPIAGSGGSEGLQNTVKQQEAKIQELSGQLRDLTGQISSRDAQIQELKRLNETVGNNGSSKDQQIESLNKTISSLTLQLGTRLKEIENLKAGLEQPGKELSQLRTRNQELEAENRQLGKKGYDLASQVQPLQAQIQQLQAQLQRLQQLPSLVQQLKDEKADLERQLKNASSQSGPVWPFGPTYKGPTSGEIVWAGEVHGTELIEIRNGIAGTGKVVSGKLPGVPCLVQPSAPGRVSVAVPPSSNNGWKLIVLRVTGNGPTEARVTWAVEK